MTPFVFILDKLDVVLTFVDSIKKGRLLQIIHLLYYLMIDVGFEVIIFVIILHKDLTLMAIIVVELSSFFEAALRWHSYYI